MDGLRELLRQARCPEDDIPSVLQGLAEHQVDSVKKLREQLQTGDDLSDLGVSVPSQRQWKKAFKNLATSAPAIDHTFAEVRLAEALSSLAYCPRGDEAFTRFTDLYKPKFLDVLQCTGTRQKYVVAVVVVVTSAATSENILGVAFAGTQDAEDWRCNLSFAAMPSTSIGGIAHSGFLLRAVTSVKANGLRRLVTAYNCGKVIFAGHSLGGAVAHLAAIRAMHHQQFETAKILAIGIGSPLCVTKQLAKDIVSEGWESRFLTVVGSLDPVPRILNIADTVQQLLQDASHLTTDIRELLHGVNGLVFQVVATGAELALSRLRARFQKMARSRARHDVMERLDVYQPFGMYIFVDRTSTETDAVFVHSLEAKERLGGAQLLRPELSLQGLLNHDGIIAHSLEKYRLHINSSGVSKHLLKNAHRGFGEGIQTAVGSLRFSVESAQYLVEDGQMRFYVMGQGLDFVGPDGIQIRCMPDAKVNVSISNDTHIAFQARGSRTPTARQTVVVTLQQDAGGMKETEVREEVAIGDAAGQAAITSRHFDEEFLRTMMKAAWIHQKCFANQELLRQFDELDELVGKTWEVEGDERKVQNRMFRHLILTTHSAGPLHEVGEDVDSKMHIVNVLEWLLPHGGHVLHTRQQRVAHAVLVGAAIACGIGIIANGGLGIVGAAVGAGGSITGGWGTSSLLVLTGFTTGAYLCRSPLKAQYEGLLADAHSWTGTTNPPSSTGHQYRMERGLIELVNLKRGRNQRPFQGPWYGHATSESETKLEELFRAICAIHEMKIIFSKFASVSIAGPQNSGKSLLSSQLMMDVDIAMRESGMQHRTVDSPVYKWTSAVLLYDSPGLTSTTEDLRQAFSRGGQLMGSIFIYIRRFSGLAEECDVTAVLKILMQASLQSPPLLICLNSVLSNLRQGTGDFLTRDGLNAIKKSFLDTLKDKANQELQRTGMQSWLGPRFGSYINRKWDKVEIVFSELGLRSESSSLPEDLRSMVSEEVYDAKRIAVWLERALQFDGASGRDVTSKVQSIDRERWQRLYDERNQLPRE